MNIPENFEITKQTDDKIVLKRKKPEPPNDCDWVPELRSEYYFVAWGNGGGSPLETCVDSCAWLDDSIDRSRLKSHNVYPTKETAEKAAKRLTVAAAMIRAQLLVCPDCEPDWDDGIGKRCFIPRRLCGEWVPDWFLPENITPLVALPDYESCQKACDLLTKWGVKP